MVESTAPRTMILIHGCHLQANGWKEIAVGDPIVGWEGRAAKGLRLAARSGVELIYWGTGASEKDGVKESCYTFGHAVAFASTMLEYADYNPYEIEAILRSRSYFDTVTQNTAEEIKLAMQVCRERGIGQLILVSSPTHIGRCLTKAEKLRAATGSKIEIYATASDTCYADSTAADVVIIEPPHRGDRTKWQTFRYARAMLRIMRQGEHQFASYLREWGDLLPKYGAEITWSPDA